MTSSGSLGSVQVIVPFLSESYSTQSDPVSPSSNFHGKFHWPRTAADCAHYVSEGVFYNLFVTGKKKKK